MVTSLPWQPQCYLNNPFVLSPTEFNFGMKLPWDELHTSLLQQLHYYGSYSDSSIIALSLDVLSSCLAREFPKPSNLLLCFGSMSCNFSSAAKLVILLSVILLKNASIKSWRVSSFLVT